MITQLLTVPSFARHVKKAAQKNMNHGSYKFAALIVQKGRVISIGLNYQFKTHPMIQLVHKHKTVHAELNAIVRTVNKDLLKGSTIVVYREDRFGNAAMSRPCVTCQYFLNQYGIKKMVYTNEEGSWVEEILPEYNFDIFFKKCVTLAKKNKGNYRDSEVIISLNDVMLDVRNAKNEVLFQCGSKNMSDLMHQSSDYINVYSHVMDIQ